MSKWPCVPRGIVLLFLFLFEILLLTLRFDMGSLVGETHGWAQFLLLAPQALQWGLTVGIVTLIFGAVHWRGTWPNLGMRLYARSLRWLYLVGHFGAFVGFAGITAHLLEGEGRFSPFADEWLVAWLVLGAATLFFWAALILPPRAWPALLRQGGRVALTGAGVGTAAWAAGKMAKQGWEYFGWATLEACRSLLSLLSADTVCIPDKFVLGTSTFQIEMAPACSGYEGIGLISVFLIVFFWFFRRELRFPRAFTLLPIGAALMWLANVGRITGLILVGTWISPAIALGGFHSQMGWLLFIAVALSMVVVARRVRLFSALSPAAKQGGASGSKIQTGEIAGRQDAETSTVATSEEDPDPTIAYLMPLMAIIATQMLTAAFSLGFDGLYPVRVLVAGVTLYYFRHSYVGLRWNWSWIAVITGTLVFVLWAGLDLLTPATAAGESLLDDLKALPRGTAFFWLTSHVLGSVITVPLAEELAFRGYLTRRLIATDFQKVPFGRFSWWSFLVSSLLFGALHGRWLAGTLAGMAYALVLYRRGEIGDAIQAHAITNALIAGCVLVLGAWHFWT